MLLMAN